MAHTIAKIQVAASDELAKQSPEIPSITLEDLPVLFDQLMGTIRDHYLTVWQSEARTSATFGLPAAGLTAIADLALLEKLQQQVHIWCSELKQLGWANSIEHIDLHTANASSQTVRC